MKSPCDDCIILGMCKAKFTEVFALVFFSYDFQRCSILQNWLSDGPSTYKKRCDAMWKLYKLKMFYINDQKSNTNASK